MTTSFNNDQQSLALTYVFAQEGVFPARATTDPNDTDPADGPHANVTLDTMGGIRLFAGNFAIGGQAADGHLIFINQNTALFSLLGTDFGGDGRLKFGVPNLYDRTLVGSGLGDGLSTDITRAQQFGADDLTLTQAQLPSPFGGGQTFSNYQPSTGVNYLIQTGGGLASDGGVNFIGSIEAFAPGFTPVGYLPADGRLLNILDYPDLFQAIGTIYGGDGQTTFALPDLRGRDIIGASTDHPVGTYLGDDDPAVAAGNLPPSLGGSSQQIDNHQPSLAMQYLVALNGIFPPRDGGVDSGPQPYIGEVIAYAGMDIPRGYAPADGRLLFINQNQPLFSLLGTFYGGDGRQTFALPDLRDRTVVGAGGQYTVGDTVGTDGIVLTDANIPPGAPVVTASGGAANASEQIAALIDPAVTLLDYDSATLAKVTVSVTGNFHSGEDVLAFVNDGGTMGDIAASYNAATGVLTLTSPGGHATVAQFQAALHVVTYTDTSDTPDTSARTISFVADDGSLTGGATKTVNVAAVNDLPVAQDGSAAGDQDTTITGTLVAVDPDNPSLTYSRVGQAAHGAVTVNPDGTFSYVPNAHYNGADSFTFKANDGAADSNVATVHITVGATPFEHAGSVDLGSHGPAYDVVGVGDFNGDGASDVLWRNATTGQVDEWRLQDGNWNASVNLGSHGAGWTVAGVGDFNGDGTSDILWREAATGHLETWIMANGQWSKSVDLGSHGIAWQVLGTGDFNGDHTSDILFQNTTTGQVDEWQMANGNWSNSISLGSHDLASKFGGAGDFNHDGTSDIVWRNPTTGAVDEWHMSGGNWAGSINLGSFNTAYDLAAVNDFNGDGTADVIWRNPTNGSVEGWVMANGQWFSSVSLGTFDPAYRLAGTGDFNHSGGTDVLWHNPTTGQTADWLLASA